MAKLTIDIPIASLEGRFRDKIIAPKISQLQEPDIPELGFSASILIDAFILNFMTTSVLKNRTRQLLFNTIRKVVDAHYEYVSGKEKLLEYCRSDRSSSSIYFAAVNPR